MLNGNRKPPAVVPTLTDVVDSFAVREGPAPKSAAFARASAGESPQRATDVDVDAVVDQLMARWNDELELRVALALEVWWERQRRRCARRVAAAVRRELATDLKAVLRDTLGTTRK